MADEDDFREEQLPLGGVGERLRLAREAKGLTAEQVAAETRINSSHIDLIENGKFKKLPGRTYAIGFSRSYARLVGLNENEIATEVRAELDNAADEDGGSRGGTFEPGDPGRSPSAKLALFSVFALILLLAGIYTFYRSYISPAADLPALQDEQLALQKTRPAKAEQVPADGLAVGPVVFTSLEDGVWVKFYDANGSQLMQKQMALNETYTVPADAEGPLLWTGRPDALSITVGGKSVPKLADDDGIMKDIPITAAALIAREKAPVAEPAGTPVAEESQ